MIDMEKEAKTLGFDTAVPFDPAILQARQDIRDMCNADKCMIFGKNWGCPPHCGSVEGYGLFVTQVCRDVGVPYYYGERTITYSACILY